MIGCPRSGTTHLGSILAALPDATYFYEPRLFKFYSRLLNQELVSRTEAKLVYRLGLHSLLLAAPGAGTRAIEKNPNHVFNVEDLASIFPAAKFVFITRDGRDVACSLRDKPWHRRDSMGSGKREPGGYLYGTYPHFYIEPERQREYQETSDLHRCIWVWRRHQEEVERLRPLVERSRTHHLRYEDLVTNHSATMFELLDFLGVPEHAREEVLDRSATGHPSSIGRWRSDLDAADLVTIDKEAGALLRKLGYG